MTHLLVRLPKLKQYLHPRAATGMDYPALWSHFFAGVTYFGVFSLRRPFSPNPQGSSGASRLHRFDAPQRTSGALLAQVLRGKIPQMSVLPVKKVRLNRTGISRCLEATTEFSLRPIIGCLQTAPYFQTA